MSFNQPSYNVIENDSGLVQACIVLEGDLGIQISVDVAFFDGSATSQDYNANENRPIQTTFGPQETDPQCFSLDITSDNLLESAEVFTMQLSSSNDAVEIGTPSVEVIILDSSEVLVGFVNTTEVITEGDSLLVCVGIITGELTQSVSLDLGIQLIADQGESCNNDALNRYTFTVHTM